MQKIDQICAYVSLHLTFIGELENMPLVKKRGGHEK